MFGAYRIGANTPSKIFIPPAPPELEEAAHRWQEAYYLAADTPNVVNDVMGVSNFFTGRKKEGVLGYYKVGVEITPTIADKLRLLPQIPTVMANPQIKVNPISLTKKNNMTDVFIVALQQAGRNYGHYPDVRLGDTASHGVPLTTVQMVFDTQAFLKKRMIASRRGDDITGDRERILAFREIGPEASRFFNIRMRQVGIPVRATDLEYIRLLKTLVIPGKLAKQFWDNFRGLAINLDSLKGRTAFTEWRLLGDAFYEQGRDVVNKIIDTAKEVPDFLLQILKQLKTVFIVLAVLLGGFLVWQIIGAVKT